MIKRILQSVREYKLPSILTPVFIIIEVLMEVIIPLVCSDLVNFLEGVYDAAENITVHTFSLFGNDMGFSVNVLDASCTWVVFVYAGILIGMAVISLVAAILAGRFCAIAASGFAKNLRKDLFYKVQDLSFENIDNYTTSSLITRLTTDVTNIQNSYMMIIRVAIRNPLMFFASLVMAFTINWFIGLIFVGAVILIGLAMLIIPFRTLPFFKKIFKKYDNMNLRVQEDVRGARVVKAFVKEDYETEKFNNASEEIKTLFTTAEVRMAFMEPLIDTVIYTLMGLICLFVSIMIVASPAESAIVTFAGNLEIGALNALMQYAMMIMMSMLFLMAIVVMVTMSFESVRRVTQVLNEEPVILNPENGKTEVADGSVEFDGVDFSYSHDINKLALSNISLSIGSGETIGILGATGSGKSSLVQLIPRLYDVTSGSIKVGGTDVRDYDVHALRKSIAMVLQKNLLFSGTIKDNIRWGKEDATDEEIIAACKLAQADEFICQMPEGYDTHIEQGGSNVSGGQRQRLCIARAIVAKPKIIIFDDSTSAVDTRTDALIRLTMERDLPDSTKIIIAQRVASVEHADKILVIDNGSVVAFGPHAELMETCDIYREAYEIQNKIAKEEN